MKFITEIRDELIECIVLNNGGDKDIAQILELWIDSIIDKCAESATTTLDTVLDKNERSWSTTVVDKQSILKVKEMIK